MRLRTVFHVLAGLAIVVSVAPTAAARALVTAPQDQASTELASPAFAQMVQGKKVRITLINGLRFNGLIGSLESDAMIVNGTRVPFARIAKIERQSNRLRNSTLVGLGLGVGVGSIGFGICASEENASDCAINLYLSPAIGTGIGLAIGALLNGGGKDIIYARSNTTTVAVAPILSATRKGVAFSIAWR